MQDLSRQHAVAGELFEAATHPHAVVASRLGHGLVPLNSPDEVFSLLRGAERGVRLVGFLGLCKSDGSLHVEYDTESRRHRQMMYAVFEFAQKVAGVPGGEGLRSTDPAAAVGWLDQLAKLEDPRPKSEAGSV